MMTAAGMRLEHGIEAGRLVDLNRRQLQVRRDRVHERRSQIPLILLLRRAQRRDHRRALAAGRETCHPEVNLLARGLAKRGFGNGCRIHQRSISPKTTSCVPMTATTSASMCPSTISLSEARWAKPGARHLRR